MIAIVDYGMGNLRSVQKALQHLGHDARITSDPAAVAAAERVIVPGVGAFGAAMESLARRNGGETSLLEVVAEAASSGRPFLGICVGMQVLLSVGEERGLHQGLGLIPGRVVGFESDGRAAAGDLRIPHMGWNALRFPRASPLFAGLEAGSRVYFVHSYYCRPEDPGVVAATADHGGEFCAALWRGNLHATQFHPEKSGAAGLRILENFARL